MSSAASGAGRRDDLTGRMRIAVGFFAVVYAAGMLVLGGTTWTRLYGPSPYHRFQGAAMLEGRLSIGDSIYQLEQNLAWHDGRVQQVWGLGVGLWLVPFEAAYRLFGQRDFPDRIAMGVAFGLLAAYSGATGLRLIRKYRRPAIGIGLTALTLFNPTLFNLSGGRHLIYEDTVLYACLVSFGILTAVVRVACFGSRTDFLLCCVLAALSGLVRPTHALYGLAGVLVCGWILCRREHEVRIPGAGWPHPSPLTPLPVEERGEPDGGRLVLPLFPTQEVGEGRGEEALLSGPSLQLSPRSSLAGRESPKRTVGRFGKVLVPGVGIFLAGLMFLAGTNWLRFGSPIEFGHRLTATEGAMTYFTRFGNPFTEASLPQACKEMFGALFLSSHRVQLNSAEDTLGGQMFRAVSMEDAVRWQAPVPRWRDLYMRTFDISVAVVVVAGIVTSVWWIKRRFRRVWSGAGFWRRPRSALVGGLLAWSLVGMLGLGCFYLFFPVLCARYLLDFAPAFAAAILLAWLGISRRFPKVAIALLVIWLGWELVSGRGGAPSRYLLTRAEIPQALNTTSGKVLEAYTGCYDIERHPFETRIAFNGEGWSPDDGTAAPIVVLAVDRPEFVELKVEPRFAFDDAPKDDHYRARIGNSELALESAQRDGKMLTVRFSVPPEIKERQGTELLFLCFVEGLDEEDRDSQRALHSVCWR